MKTKPFSKDIEKWLYKWITNLLNKYIKLNLVPMAEFTQEQHLTLLVLAALDNTSAEAIAQDKHRLPAADTVFNAIKKLGWKEVKKGFDKILDATFFQLRKQRMLWGSVTLAIDFHDDRYYGDKDDEGVVGTKPERGTCYAFRIATIEIVMHGWRFTLAEVPFINGMKNADIVEHLIRKVERYVKIKEVLLDGEFYEAEVIERLNKLKVKYIIRADMSKKLREQLKRANRERGYKSPWTVNKEAETTLVAFYGRKKKSEKKTWYAWVTNTYKSPRRIYKLYKRRWGIETGYRVKGNFQANTCSKNFTIRIMYSLLAICLYNLWVLVNLLYDFDIIKMIVASCKKYKPSITTRMVRKGYEAWLLSVCESIGV
jgi:putative transposase